jgi:DNA repair protein SbcC/Rad50
MIPAKLEIYNFLAYRSPEPLDLTGMHMVCLAGANGAGKSSLLDAITWSLWGKARAHSDNELIHADQMEMWVRLTFSLEGNLYRVWRYRSRKDRGKSELSLEVQNEDDWRSLTESTIKATEDRINSLLRLDYSTFINSAFLVQGRADEFTKKTPAERKAILGEILGLESWTQFEDRAKQHLRATEQEQAQIDAQIEGIDAELASEGQYKDDLIAAREALDHLSQQVHEAQEQYSQLQTARAQLDGVRTQYADLQNRLGQGQLELSHLQAERQHSQDSLQALQDLLLAREDIEAGYSAWVAARQKERELAERSREQIGLLQRQTVLREAIALARAELASRRNLLAQRLSDHEHTVKEGGNGAAVQEVRDKVEALVERENEMAVWKEQIAGLREQQARLETISLSLKAEVERLGAERRQIESVKTPVCPLCGQPLSDEHRADLVASLEEKRSAKDVERRESVQRLEAFQRDIQSLTKNVKTAEPELRNLPPLRQRLAVLEGQADRASESQGQIEALGVELASIDVVLDGSDYAQAEQAELADLESGLTALGYDETAHREIQAAVTQYEGYETRKADLDRALEAIPPLEAAIAGLDSRLAAWQETLAGDHAAMVAAEALIGELEGQLVDYDSLERRLSDLRDEEGNARALVGAAEQKIKALADQRVRRAELVERREECSREHSIFEDLRLAFGKDGVPAMIIEAAIPEIEEGANQILARMTDGRMNIRFDTQREKVTGGIKETLDIKIADELGTRDYATFSGGEAFRVNFAVRLALSRLLARRAGAQLRTLIIDEGFGTQDAQGRERLVSALNAIQDEFDLIMVITHIDELKEAFPARIEVTKTAAGSLIEVI